MGLILYLREKINGNGDFCVFYCGMCDINNRIHVPSEIRSKFCVAPHQQEFVLPEREREDVLNCVSGTDTATGALERRERTPGVCAYL